MPRLDRLKRGDLVRWQETYQKVANVHAVSDHLVCVSFYTDDDDYQVTTRPLGAGIRVPQTRARPRHDDDQQDHH